MSLLSSTQGTPERVWSLISVLSANDGVLERTEATNALNPGFRRGDNLVSEKPSTFQQTLGAATSLGVVEVDGPLLRLSASHVAMDYAAFCDWVHSHLASLDSQTKDAVIIDTYAWMVAESDKVGSVGWVHDWSNDTFADAADKALPDEADDDGDRRINREKLPTWRRWLTCIGLMVPMPLSIRDLPSVEVALMREIPRLGLPLGKEVESDTFLKALALRMPYLDGGRKFAEAAKRIGHAPTPGKISPNLSAGLRNLHDDGTIELVLRGDAGRVVRLSAVAGHKMQTFHAVTLKRQVSV